jgi:hypothetical protein
MTKVYRDHHPGSSASKSHEIIMEYMIRFTQTHESFRLAEIKALAVLEDIELEILSYSPSVSCSCSCSSLFLTRW